MTEVLSRRHLNRATLARKYLLERATVPAIDATSHLAGGCSRRRRSPVQRAVDPPAGLRAG